MPFLIIYVKQPRLSLWFQEPGDLGWLSNVQNQVRI